MKPVKNNMKLVAENKQVELTEDEQKVLAQVADNVEALEKEYKDNENVILQIQNLSAKLAAAQNAYAAEFYKLVAKYKFDVETTSPTQDRKGIQIQES